MKLLRLIIISLILSLFLNACGGEYRTPVLLVTALTTSVTSDISPTRIAVHTATYTPEEVTTQAKSSCIKSFAEFAYYLKAPDQTPKPEITLPLSPWQFEASIPTQKVEGYQGYLGDMMNIETSRSINGRVEIWLVQLMTGSEWQITNKNFYQIYRPESQNWETISAEVGESETYTDGLFVMPDGSIWGRIVWDPVHGDSQSREIPVLSKLNERTRHFEFAEGAPKIELVHNPNYFDWPYILLDHKGIFWIFMKNDGLYRYDPSSGTTEKRIDLPNYEIDQAAVSPDGSIYFEVYDERVFYNESLFRLSDGMLYQFRSETDELVSLDIPNNQWPMFGGMLFDESGRLWLGSSGYRTPNGDWHLIHPNPQEYINHAGDPFWIYPKLMIESSDGVLWYQKFLDGDTRGEGTAWYDPQTGKGCMFTNLAGDIVEDSEQRLWLEVAGKLYKYEIKE